MAVWPATLPPAPALGAFSAQRQDNRILSDNELGDQKTRRRFTAVAKDFDWPLTLTAAQKDILSDFIETDLVDGTLTFTIADPESLEASKTMRIITLPKYEKLGPDAWRATMAVRRVF